ncbi:MAG: hypothetical protein DRR08_07535 [Candidatus Parabeggiatoa sp. nov. 2]|nr:MAG: hypothetical protein B6247_03490 [Beggiatoa sp. 4572_84]RKZ61888.1 MAG: hypothetical protein DRR08_07535 [Gammaproteobacteria bacterium]
MFELKISDLSDALWLSEDWATHTVSLLDPDIENYDIEIPVAGKDGQLRRYYFHDILSIDELDDLIVLLENPTLATSQQVQEILEFTAPLQSTDKLLVHCQAGVSRSTAVACGVLCQHGLTPDEAVNYVFSIREIAFPNEHVLTLFDDILGLEGKLVAAGSEEIVEPFRQNNLPYLGQ